MEINQLKSKNGRFTKATISELKNKTELDLNDTLSITFLGIATVDGDTQFYVDRMGRNSGFYSVYFSEWNVVGRKIDPTPQLLAAAEQIGVWKGVWGD
jgi:hypothetical protein